MNTSIPERRNAVLKASAASLGAGLAVTGMHEAAQAVPPLANANDQVMNMATKAVNASAFSMEGANALGRMTAQVNPPCPNCFPQPIGSTVSVASAGGSMYAQSYVRCQSTPVAPPHIPVTYSVFSSPVQEGGASATSPVCQVLSGYTTSMISYGAIIGNYSGNAVPGVTDRTMSNGSFGSTRPNTAVSNEYLSYYPSWTTSAVALASLAGPSSPLIPACW